MWRACYVVNNPRSSCCALFLPAFDVGSSIFICTDLIPLLLNSVGKLIDFDLGRTDFLYSYMAFWKQFDSSVV